ncbi:MAG: phosphoglucosamine mutase, partial [Acidobacteria bacterium]|nr:phosphoglucosamine mutase [Acidobacteriota bacterium]
MAKQLFGTDGIRGVAGEFPLDAKTAFAFGVALGGWAARHSRSPEVVIGMDTRESGPWLAEHVAGGLAAGGIRVRSADTVTTPGIAYLTRTGPFVAGVMISASHNLYQDNGIKVFDHSGYKLPDEQEHEIEQEIFAVLEGGVDVRTASLAADASLDDRYIDHLASTVDTRFDGLHLVVDCANGAASPLARPLFERLGAAVSLLCASP